MKPTPKRPTANSEAEPSLELLALNVPWVKQRAFTILTKTASAMTGRFIPVRAGSPPRAMALRSQDRLDTIYLPTSLSNRLVDLKAALGHECLHIAATSVIKLHEVSFGVWLLTQSLEDARIEIRLEKRFPGIHHWIQTAVYAFQAQRAFLLQLDTNKKTYVALSAVCKALYALLAHEDSALALQISGSEYAVDLAQDLWPKAKPVFEMENTQEVVELAKHLLDALEEAIEQRKKDAKSPEAARFYQSLGRQVSQARSVRASEVVRYVERLVDDLGNRWRGPWWRYGGYSFPTKTWEIKPSAQGKWLSDLAPRSYQLLDWMMEADPLKEEQFATLDHQTTGRLAASASVLVKAAVGRYRHVFHRREEDPHPILPELLSSLGAYVLLIEAHMRYDQSAFDTVKLLAVAYARLFELLKIPFSAQAFSATLPEIEEFDPKTGQWKKRESKTGHLHLATFHTAADKEWSAHELGLLSLPPQGFNLPFEGIPRCLSIAQQRQAPQGQQSGQAKPQQQKIVMCFGDLDELNVYLSDLNSTVNSYQSQGYRFLYFNVGVPPEGASLSQERKRLEQIYDEIVDVQDLRQGFIDGLQALLVLLIGEMGFVGNRMEQVRRQCGDSGAMSFGRNR